MIRMIKNQKKNIGQLIIEIIIIIYLYVNIPSWEKNILEVISSNPEPLRTFNGFWNNLILFLLSIWEIIAFIIVIELLYKMIFNRNLLGDILKGIKQVLKQ